MSIESLAALAGRLASLGAVRIYAKDLPQNNNTKQQIYLGGSFEVLHHLPFGEITPSPASPDKVMHAPIRLAWIHPTAAPSPAPESKLVLYPQYPEVRLSGFVRGSAHAPAEWLSIDKKGATPGRILFLAPTSEGQVLAYLVPPDTPLAREFQLRRSKFEAVGVLADLTPLLPRMALPSADEALLLAELARIHAKGWIDAKRLLSDGRCVPCKGPNCGGSTLEAELGIAANGKAEPDFHGWEVKQHTTRNLRWGSAGAITLFTPEPDGGDYREKGPASFVRTYGADTVREGIAYFQGIHRAGDAHERTRLTLKVIGFDPLHRKVTTSSGCLSLQTPGGHEAARWSFAKLITHWCRKHAKAAYVPAQRSAEGGQLRYRYGADVRLYRQTDAMLLLAALSDGIVYYDPGIKLEKATDTTHRRSQFRVKFRDLKHLYHTHDQPVRYLV